MLTEKQVQTKIMFKKFSEFLLDAMGTSLFATLFVVISWILTLKSRGALKTEEEWYGFGAFIMQIAPLMMGFAVIVQVAILLVLLAIARIYCYFFGEKENV